MNFLTTKTQLILDSALGQFGNDLQISTAIGELNELAAVAVKWFRYEDKNEAIEDLRGRILDECADVLNCMVYLQTIFNISDLALIERAEYKMERVAEWLNTKDPLKASVKDRLLPGEKPCRFCVSNGSDPFKMPCMACRKPEYKGYVASIKEE